jgi:hypothetical protein
MKSPDSSYKVITLAALDKSGWTIQIIKPGDDDSLEPGADVIIEVLKDGKSADERKAEVERLQKAIY